LVVQIADSPDPFQLFAESATEFFFKTFDAQVNFVANRAGETTGFAVTFNN
jgi:hypothetical protein